MKKREGHVLQYMSSETSSTKFILKFILFNNVHDK